MTRELTDEQLQAIEDNALENGTFFDVYRAIIKADRALRVPMTQPEVIEAFCRLPHDVQYVSVFEKGIRAAERFHGIGEKT